MQLLTLSVGALQTNCYILYTENGYAAVVDPGDQGEYIVQVLKERNLTVKQIWLTHGHFDHMGGVDLLKQVFDCKILAHCAEKTLLKDPSLNLSGVFGKNRISMDADIELKDEETFSFEGETVILLHTPGHTAGSCCFLIGDWLFSGDTLFAGSCGRVDFPTGDAVQMMGSLKRLSLLKGDYTVFSGHGEATSLVIERVKNPYMK